MFGQDHHMPIKYESIHHRAVDSLHIFSFHPETAYHSMAEESAAILDLSWNMIAAMCGFNADNDYSKNGGGWCNSRPYQAISGICKSLIRQANGGPIAEEDIPQSV